MVALIEKELQLKDKELKELLKNLPMDTLPGVSNKVESINTEKEILHKLLKEQKLQRRTSLLALENGLLVFAIAVFGALAAFVFYLVSAQGGAQGTWEQMGSGMAVLTLLFVMTTLSIALYTQHYKERVLKK